MEVTVDESGRDELSADIQTYRPVVIPHADDDPVADRHIRRNDFARKHVDDPAARKDEIRRDGSSGRPDAPFQTLDRRRRLIFHRRRTP
jgi:hypothetical protein